MKMRVLFFTTMLFLITKLSYAQKDVYEKSGDILQIALPSLAFTSTLIWNDGSKPILQFVNTMGTSVLLTHSLKRIIDKERPNGGRYGFPSGHTSSAFTGAAFIQRRYGWKLGIPSYIIASYVGWTRIHANAHDTWDVIGGATIGIVSSYLFTKPFKKEDVKLSLLNANTKGFSIGLTYKF
ncbi:phosphatase PAP2 family protein [uncultured Maribacter sp.]|uniref:phosphatase PAP2 family protein n=1 Tax=uncultured Maribacter sp. TaxID=431308 RepID=UPI0026257F94|nr:phosphatase PAP2 family protein [uncultured Maribacter sp.]